MFAGTAGVPPLVPASAWLLDPSGRSVGHVRCTGPVPWRDAVRVGARRLGGTAGAGPQPGRALMVRALHGARAAGLPTLEPSVADGNSARRLYDSLGLRPLTRTRTVDLPLS